MIVFPNAKINLGLRILKKRPDGFHNISTCFVPIAFRDALEILPSRDSRNHITQTGLQLNLPDDQNMCVRAWAILKEEYPELPAVHIHLHKAIPFGAGLGGGSADGSFTLKAICDLFKLNPGPAKLAKMALQLGSDCPFFLLNQTAIGTGRGEQLEPVSLPLTGFKVFIVNPRIPVSTAWAFAQITPTTEHYDLQKLLSKPVQYWKQELFNDFEPAVFSAHPAIGELKEWMYQQGAIYASMSGTGSTVYGIFESGIPDAALLPTDYLCCHTELT